MSIQRLGTAVILSKSFLSSRPKNFSENDKVNDLIEKLKLSYSTHTRCEAVRKLGVLKAVKAIPYLINLLQDEYLSVAEAANNALTRMGKDAVPYLKKALPKSDNIRKRNIIIVLGNIGAPAMDTITLILTSLRDNDPALREVAASALGRIGIATYPVIDGLIALLTDNDEGVRCASAEALGRIKPAPTKAIDALKHAMNNDKSSLVQIYAKWALNQIDPDNFPLPKGFFKPKRKR